jgi:hypothetical protein
MFVCVFSTADQSLRTLSSLQCSVSFIVESGREMRVSMERLTCGAVLSF